VTKIWDRGVARGELDPNVDPEVALDLIFGAAMYRLATGHAGLTPADADAIVATANADIAPSKRSTATLNDGGATSVFNRRV
jgi:hypothetical protein